MTTFAELTTMQVGGLAAQLVEVTSEEGFITALRDAWASSNEWLILGGGSNTIVSDAGFAGPTILVRTQGFEIIAEHDDGVLVRVAAGQNWDEFVAWAVAEGLSGVEALSGIPGSVGAAPVQNIGAYGQELSDTLASIDFLPYGASAAQVMNADELHLGYRDSAIKQGMVGAVIAVTLRLQRSAVSRAIMYPQLAQALNVSVGDTAPLPAVRAAVLNIRAEKGMVLIPGDADTVSCGSFFVNPIVTESFARALPEDAPRYPLAAEEQDRILSPGDHVPGFAGPGLVKLSAAWLIENAGVSRGYQIPGSKAGISTKHTLAVTNRGGASTDDVTGLARYVQALVQSHFGIVLRPEPNLVNCEV